MEHLLWEKWEGQSEEADLKGCVQRERECLRAEFEVKYFLLCSQHEAWDDIENTEWKWRQGTGHMRLVGAAKEPRSSHLPQKIPLLWTHFLFNLSCDAGGLSCYSTRAGALDQQVSEQEVQNGTHPIVCPYRADWYFNIVLRGELQQTALRTLNSFWCEILAFSMEITNEGCLLYFSFSKSLVGETKKERTMCVCLWPEPCFDSKEQDKVNVISRLWFSEQSADGGHRGVSQSAFK